MNEQLNALAVYPSAQGSKSFDASKVVEQFMNRGYDGLGGARGAEGWCALSSGVP